MDSLFNDKLLDSMFDDKDTSRYENGAPVKRWFSDGPGSYTCEVVAVRTGVGEGEKNYGVNYFVVEFKVVDARPGKDVDGAMQPPTHSIGEVIGHVKFLAGRIPIKEALETAGAIMRLPPAVMIPEGFPHAGKVLPLVNGRSLSKLAVDDGAAVAGRRVHVDIVGQHGKEGTKHAGKVFYNTRFAPIGDDGEPMTYPAGAALAEKMGRDRFVAAIYGKFGNPDAPVARDEDIPF